MSASESIVQLSGYIKPLFFLSFLLSVSQTKEPFSQLVPGSCVQSATRARRL